MTENFVERQIVLGAGASFNGGSGYPLGAHLAGFLRGNNKIKTKKSH